MTTRQFFSETEKKNLQELIVKYKINKCFTRTLSEKKTAWNRLVEEFNSIETNTYKRTESQLKKCWDNLKTRRKSFLTLEKRQRVKTGGEICSYNELQPDTSQETLLLPDDLSEQADVKIQGVIDSDIATVFIADDNIMTQWEIEESPYGTTETDQETETDREVINTPRRSGSRAQIQVPKNARSRLIRQNIKTEKREGTLHNLKLKEREWMARAAELTFYKVKAEREAAEELLRCNIAKRKVAEIELDKIIYNNKH